MFLVFSVIPKIELDFFNYFHSILKLEISGLIISNNINWDLIAELYSTKKSSFNFIQEIMIEKSLSEAGWSQNRTATASEYKKVWALAVVIELGLNDDEIDKKIQWGYNIINKYFGI